MAASVGCSTRPLQTWRFGCASVRHRVPRICGGRPSPASRPSARTVLAAAGEPNVFIIDGSEYTVPPGAVQQLPVPLQQAAVLSIFAALGVGTYLTCSQITPAIASAAPWLVAGNSVVARPLMGLIFMAAGTGHFTAHSEFLTMYPKEGAWGFWYLPGSPSFHVNWTGVAEVLGGAALLLGSLPPVHDAFPDLQSLAALCLFALVIAITPSNIFMFTHNAPGPGPRQVLPPAAHGARLVMQIVLLTVLWDLAHPQ